MPVGTGLVGSSTAQQNIARTQERRVSETSAAIKADDIGRPRRKRVLNTSSSTAIYNQKGKYPALRLFQFAHPVPQPRPFDRLVKNFPEVGNSLFVSRYTVSPEGRSENSSRILDHLV